MPGEPLNILQHQPPRGRCTTHVQGDERCRLQLKLALLAQVSLRYTDYVTADGINNQNLASGHVETKYKYVHAKHAPTQILPHTDTLYLVTLNQLMSNSPEIQSNLAYVPP
jgi:hypothetical protein